MSINLNEYMIDMRGNAYLPVAPRIVAFREAHPDWAIMTDFREVGESWLAQATVTNDEGRVIATAHKEVQQFKAGGKDASWTKAETGAIGRALSACGFGTIQAGDMDEGDEIADAPIERRNGNGASKPSSHAASDTDEDMATQKQREFIAKLAKGLFGDQTGPIMRAMMIKKTGKESSTDLTKRDASTMIEWLKGDTAAADAAEWMARLEDMASEPDDVLETI